MIAAPFVGSFLGVLVRRLPHGQAVVVSRSHCDACAATLDARDLVPLVSFIAFRGRCRHCGEPISSFYPAIELAATAVALSAVMIFDDGQSWLWCILGWGLLALAWIDYDWMILPDILTLPLLVTGLGIGIFDGADSMLQRATGAAAGWGAFAGIAWIYRRLRHRDGLGGGDAKLLGVAGAWLGIGMLPWVAVLAAVAAGTWTVAQRAWRGQSVAEQPVVFGPWLAASIWAIGLLAGACEQGYWDASP